VSAIKPGMPAKPGRPGQGSQPDPRPGSAARVGGSADGADPRRDPAAVRQFIERFTAILTQAGFPRTPARIFVALLTADSSSMTAAELGQLLDASPASVSGGARYLLQVGLITAEGEPGSRRQHYRMSVHVWQDIVSLRDRQFARWATELEDGVRILGEASPAGRRMAETVRYFEFISGEMAGLLARWKQQESGR
jgi:DNA-binding transcriptional regulator GbsR (MarR family)